MQTRSSSKLTRDQTSNPASSTNTTPKGRTRRSSKQKVKNSNFEEHLPPVATMADNRTMAEMLRAPTEECAEAIVVPLILAEQFELKHSLINMMTSKQFFGLEMDNPHDHIRWFNKITSTIKYRDAPNSMIKLILFPFSLAGAARRWLEKEPPRSITTWDVLVSKFINEFFSPSRTTNLRNEITNFHQKFDESFHEAWERYKDLLRACSHHGFTELHQLDTFYNALNPADQDSLNAATGGNLLEKSPQDALTIIENKSKVCNSRSKPIASQVKACYVNSNSEIAKLTHAVNQQTSVVTTAMTAMLKQLQATPPPAPVKAVEETFVTYGGAHLYYQCLATGGNTFPEFKDNIQGYVSAAAGNYNQGNLGYHPQGVANQMRPPGFAQPNVQNNQNQFGPPQGFNRGNNFNQEQSYQATAQPNQNFHLNELEKIKRMNEVSMKAMQNQIDMVKNELRNKMKTSIQTSLSNQTNAIKNMMASLLQMNTASTSGGLVNDGPTVPTPPKFITPKVGERVEETYTDPDLAEDSPLSNIPYPLRMLKQKHQEKDEVQIQKFWQMFKQLHLNITLAEALVIMPKYQKMLKALLLNKEKLQELANTPLNENCSVVIPKKLPEKHGDPGKFLIPYGFSELKCNALADLGASINLMPLSVWKELGLPELIPTRMTLELANRAISTPDGIARDVFVPVGKTARALIDVHGEEMILRDGDERLTLNMKHDTARYSNHPQRESVNLINIFNVSSEDFLKVSVSNQPSGNPTFSLHQELTSPKVTHEIHDSKGCNVLSEKLLDIDSINDIHPYSDDNPLSGSTTYLSNSLLEEFTDELACKDSSLKDSIDQTDLANLDDYFVDPTPEMFTDEHAPDYSSPLRFDVYDDDFLEVVSDADNVYDDPLDSKGEKIKEVKALPLRNNEDKLFNPGILIHEKPIKIITRVAQDKKLPISYASLVFEDFDPPFCEPLFFKDVPKSKMLLSFSSENEEKVFKPGIYTSKKPGHLAARLGCAEMKVAAWDDLTFKLIPLGWNGKRKTRKGQNQNKTGQKREA
nr:hypothetical protein [Tanacetum cinerariifolium]